MFRCTVAWMLSVWLMCVARKSSKRLRTPGASSAGVNGSFSARHFTALMKSVFSSGDKLPLKQSVSSCHDADSQISHTILVEQELWSHRKPRTAHDWKRASSISQMPLSLMHPLGCQPLALPRNSTQTRERLKAKSVASRK